MKNQPVLIVEYGPETKNHKLLLKYLGRMKKYSFYVPGHGRYYNSKLVAVKKLTGYRGKLTNIICVPERFSDHLLNFAVRSQHEN